MPTRSSTAIQTVRALEVLDSRGRPTVEVEVLLVGGGRGRALVPSGASTGAHEALELRDGGPRYFGAGVLRAVGHVEGELQAAVQGVDAADQQAVDAALRAADGTAALSSLGANAVLGVSLAAAHAAADGKGVTLVEHAATIFGAADLRMPVPMLNVLNGGAHADNQLDVQEIMVAPVGVDSFAEALRAGAEIYHALKTILTERGLSVAVGDEGGFAPRVANNAEAIGYVAAAIERAGYEPGSQVALALDVAASEIHGPEGYIWEGAPISAEGLVAHYARWCDEHPIYSIEDGLDEDDWDGWRAMTERLGAQVQLVGDDLFVTNVERLQRGIDAGVANAVLIKPNQVGTLSDTFACVQTAYDAGFGAVMSHRSGETEDATIADLAVATATGQIKAGAPCRGERTAKYNQLLRIEAAAARAGTPLPYGLRTGTRS